MQQTQHDNHVHHERLARLAARGRVNAATSRGSDTGARRRFGAGAGRYVATGISASGFMGIVVAMAAAPPGWSQDAVSEPIALAAVTTTAASGGVGPTPMAFTDAGEPAVAVPEPVADAGADSGADSGAPGPPGTLGPPTIRSVSIDSTVAPAPGSGSIPATTSPGRPPTSAPAVASSPPPIAPPGVVTDPAGLVATEPAATTPPGADPAAPGTAPPQPPAPDTTSPPPTSPPSTSPPTTAAPTTVPPTTIPPTTLPECVGSSC